MTKWNDWIGADDAGNCGNPQCDMSDDCRAPVTHIGNKGFIYCAAHGTDRRRYRNESTRRMRAWEIKLIRAGKPLPSYKPIRKPEGVE